MDLFTPAPAEPAADGDSLAACAQRAHLKNALSAVKGRALPVV